VERLLGRTPSVHDGAGLPSGPLHFGAPHPGGTPQQRQAFLGQQQRRDPPNRVRTSSVSRLVTVSQKPYKQLQAFLGQHQPDPPNHVRT